MKRILPILLIFIIALGACAGPVQPPAPPVATAPEAAPDDCCPPEDEQIEEADNASQLSFYVVDQAGREVYIEGPVERLVSGFFISTSACIALGLTDRLVGVESRVGDRPLFMMSAPELLDLPETGTARDFNLETTAALEPDLVILPLRLMDASEILTELGITVIMVNPESHEELVEMIELIGRATGTDSRARQLIQHYEDELAAIAALVAMVDQRPIVQMGGNSSYLTTAPRDMYQASLIYSAGGINVAHDIEGRFWTEISYEELIALNPEVIIIPSEAAYSKDDILANPMLSLIDAVATGRVYAMPRAFEAWDAPVPSGILGLRWMLHVLHPDLYSLEELRENAAAFYREFYGIEIDTSVIGS